MSEKKIPRVRMVVIEKDGKTNLVSPFNRDAQELREKEAKSFGMLDHLRRALG